MLADFLLLLDELYEWDAANLQKIMNDHRESIGWKPKDYFMSIRLVVSGRKDSPPLPETMEVLGREMVRFRIRDVLESPVLQ
jgi:glutamyl/glutaminyl-tRNA synthetase